MSPDACQSTVTPLVVPEIVTFPPEIDISNAARLGAELLAAFRPGVAVVIADMTLTDFCDSSGILQLMIANEQAKGGLAQLRVVAARGGVLRVLQVTGADQVLDVYPSLHAALASRSPDTPDDPKPVD